jgi:hypothetical protein
MKAYRGIEVCLHSFLTSAIDGGECSASCCGQFIPGERALVPIEQGAWWAPELV